MRRLWLRNGQNIYNMANIHEITRNLIEFRGEVKAAQINTRAIGNALCVDHDDNALAGFLGFLKYLDSDVFTGCIWFESGSYAYLDKDGAGYYWNFIQVPEIPKELC